MNQRIQTFEDKLRESEIWLFIGTKRCGKTTEALRLCKKAGLTVFIVSYSPKDRGLAKFATIDSECIDMSNIKPGAVLMVNTLRPDKTIYDILADLSERVYNSVIILDDSKSQVGANPGGEFIKATGAVRHNCNDIYLTYWSLNDPSPYIYQMCDYVALFKTGFTSFNRSSEKIPRSADIGAAYDWIQRAETPDYSYAFISMHPMSPLSQKGFIKVLPQNKN